MKRTITAVLSALVILALALAAPTAAVAGKGAAHKPPYKKGPSGGDEFNETSADPESGSVSVYRLFPGFSPVVGCAPEPDAGWATLHVVHDANGSERSAIADFSNASLDSYAWITVAAFTGKDNWLGAKKLQGPVFGESGKVKVQFTKPVHKGDQLTIEFGVQLGDSCPQVSFAEATFPKITIL